MNFIYAKGKVWDDDDDIEELKEALREIIADAMDNPTSIKAIVTWTSIHKAQKLLEER